MPAKTRLHEQHNAFYEDKDCLASIYTKYRGDFLRQMAHFHQGRKEDFEDAFQDAMLVLAKLDAEHLINKSEQQLKAYVFKIAINKWLMTCRKLRRISCQGEIDADHFPIAEVMILKFFDFTRRRRHAVRKAMFYLSAKDREILERFYFGSQNLKMIAQEMGFQSAEVVAVTLSRSRTKLKKLVLKHYSSEIYG